MANGGGVDFTQALKKDAEYRAYTIFDVLFDVRHPRLQKNCDRLFDEHSSDFLNQDVLATYLECREIKTS